MVLAMSGPDYIVDIDGVGTPANDVGQQATSPRLRHRPWLAVHWRCCNVYSRIYRNKSGRLYEGRCPRCQRSATATVGPGGTSDRFFEAR